ncbi:unnamed protein product [Brachionus calyciflorus]|uniref:RRM domain-containing protein n=1 Tax=Brachionus calyciflorus TaxID=104777 RepID=A0A813MPR2_9BILA|nr:unnamed protein product [Brachionus calyciflorus]
MIPYQSKYTTTLCVRNLTEDVTREDLKNEFGRFGNIVDIMIPVDFHTRQPKGYCFIEFEDFYQAEDAFYSLHLSTFFGEKIEIDYAKSDWKREIQIREQLQFLKESCNINELKIKCIHALNMSGI